MIPFDKISVALVISLTSLLGGQAMRARRPNGHEHAQGGAVPGNRPGHTPQTLPPVLLMTPAHYGTLAAVRSLGRGSVPVTTAGPSPWTVSGFSKYTTASLSCPRTTDTDGLLAWLEEFGKTHERHVLLPTCDDTAWLYARHRDWLSELFYMGSSGVETIHALLHKGKLAEHARAVELDTPHAWFPQSPAEVAAVADQARFPVLLKPTTQALFPARSKGIVVHDREGLTDAFAQLSSLVHGAAIVDYDASAARPMVQEFFPDASEGIYNISGYVHQGQLRGARAGRKLLQQPRRLGVGVCFEEAPLAEHLVSGLARLVQRVGFNGVFEAEFVRTAERDVLIDFNPRFYNQMGFDVARGLPLPLLAYYDAIRNPGVTRPPGRQYDELDSSEPTGKVFVYASAFKLMVMSQRASGALTSEEAAAWLDWYASTEGKQVDAVEDPDDVWPGRLDLLQMFRHHMRHPRKFLKSIVLNR